MISGAAIKKILYALLAFAALEAVLGLLFYFYNHHEADNRKYQILMGDIIAARLVSAQSLDPKTVRKQIIYDTGLEGLKKFMRGEKQGSLFTPELSNIHAFEVVLGEDIPNSSDPNLKKIWSRNASLFVLDEGERVKVYAKLVDPATSKPYGVLKITSTPGNLFWQVFEENAMLYFAIALLANLEAGIIAAIALKPRKPVETAAFEKGYLKEHAVGALKLQHKILGDIIKDHDKES